MTETCVYKFILVFLKRKKKRNEQEEGNWSEKAKQKRIFLSRKIKTV